MTNLYIQLNNGEAINHPIIEENLIQAFPDVDLNNLSSNFAKFVRIQPPLLEPYQKINNHSYQLVNDCYQDVWDVVNLTDDEIKEKQAEVILTSPFPSWILNTKLCIMEPPIPYPTDGSRYIWNEETVSWESA